MSARVEVFFISLLLIIIIFLNLMLLKKFQKKITFIHPGWILVIANGLYGLFVPVAFILLGDDLGNVYAGVAKYFDGDHFENIMWMYLILAGGFLYAQMLITMVSKLNFRNNYSNKVENKKSYIKPINKSTIRFLMGILCIFGVYLIYLRLSLSGGVLAAFSLSRRELAASIADSGVFTRYEYFLQPFFIISLSYLLIVEKINKKVLRKEKLLFNIILILYILYLFLSGIRLNIIVLALGLFYVAYTNSLVVINKEEVKLFISKFWLKNKHKILLMTVIVFILFGWYSYQRNYIRSSILGSGIQFDSVSLISLLFPSEFSTGYVPGLIILNSGFTELGTPYWLKFIPSSILSFFGMDAGLTVSKDLAWSLHGVGRSAVYTITMPLDIYTATTNYFMIFIIGFVVYTSIWLMFKILSKKMFWGNCSLAIVFLNLFYIIRVEAANWFPRVWQGLLIVYVIWIVYSVLSKIRIRRRRIINTYLTERRG